MNDVLIDLGTDDDINVPQNELDRITATEQNVNIRQKLEVFACIVFIAYLKMFSCSRRNWTW